MGKNKVKLIYNKKRGPMITVCNAIETRYYKPIEGGYWIDYWKNEYKKIYGRFSIVNASDCNNPNCTHKNEASGKNIVGAHVVSLDENEINFYILPLCERCNDEKGGLVPFGIELYKCIPIPDECIYDDGSGNPYEIANAIERIKEANEEYVEEKRQQL